MNIKIVTLAAIAAITFLESADANSNENERCTEDVASAIAAAIDQKKDMIALTKDAVTSAITANPNHAPDIVKAAVKASGSNSELISSVVESATQVEGISAHDVVAAAISAAPAKIVMENISITPGRTTVPPNKHFLTAVVVGACILVTLVFVSICNINKR